MSDQAKSSSQPHAQSKSGAIFVGLGILLSRISGLVRERIFAHYFGNSDASDAFKAALKIPNFLQNLFGEGVLSASFIPVYAKLLADKHDEDAAKVASIVGSLLFLVTSLLVVLGVFATPLLIGIIAPGFEGEKKALTIQIVQILFPGTGFLVLSAWCLGILNSHKKFFLSYVAPVIWNVTIILTLVFWGRQLDQNNLAIYVAWGLVLGSFLQFFVQTPSAFRLAKKVRPKISFESSHVRTIVKNFGPSVLARGVVQVSAYIDNMLASLLPTGAVSALAYAQTLYLLPVSLFGMSVSASELPMMSQARGTSAEISEYLRTRLNSALEKIAFFIIPSVVGFLILGDIIVSALFQTGEFKTDSTEYVWMVLAGSTVGLLASTMGRLYSSCFYSLKDTRTPLKFALIRVFLTTLLGWLFAFILPPAFNLSSNLATAGLTASAGIAGWVEFYLLRRKLNQQIGASGLKVSLQIKLWVAALVASLFAFVGKIFWGDQFLILRAVVCLGVFGIIYFAICYAMNVQQVKPVINKILRKK